MEFMRYESPLGPLWLTGQEGILTGLSFDAPREGIPEDSFHGARCWLDDYFEGVSREIDFPMEPSGTPFQKLIWSFLLEIPYGKTVTYGDLARAVARAMGKDAMSAQAVGQAVGRNPIAIIIPCHRVVGTGGKLTGYAAGLDRKQWLLTYEKEKMR